MKTGLKFSIILISVFCFSQTNSDKYIIDDDGIAVEKFEKNNTDDNKYNLDNKIYVVGKKFTYSYYHQTVENKKLLIAKGEQIKYGKDYINDWKFIDFEKQNNETVKSIILKPISGNPFKNYSPDYSQTGISYEYMMNNSEPLTMEVTGAIENEMNIWIHPPRSTYFEILELNPFPYIKSPYEIGKKWSWKLKIGDRWSDKRWLEWKGEIINNYQYEIVDRKNVKTEFGNLECFVIKANAESRIGKTELISYFNEDYGFIRLEYKNIDGSKTVLELQKFENTF